MIKYESNIWINNIIKLVDGITDLKGSKGKKNQ